MRKTRREAAESQQEAAVAMVETAAPPPADPADEIPSLATEAAEAARLEVVRLADVEERLRERIREADGTSTGYARAAGTSAAMAGDLSGEPDPETIRSALEVEIRREYAEGALEEVHRALKRAVRAWQLAIHAALIPARNTVEAKVRRHAAREAEVRRQASGETSDLLASMPTGSTLSTAWRPAAVAEWQAEGERLEEVRARLLAVMPALASWRPDDPASLRNVISQARRGVFG